MAIDGGFADGLAIDRNQPFAFLPRGFRDQLLGPGAEIGDLSGRRDRHLVTAREPGQTPSRVQELRAGILMRRNVGAAGAAIESACEMRLPMSIPAVAAGTNPNGDSTE